MPQLITTFREGKPLPRPISIATLVVETPPVDLGRETMPTTVELVNVPGACVKRFSSMYGDLIILAGHETPQGVMAAIGEADPLNVRAYSTEEGSVFVENRLVGVVSVENRLVLDRHGARNFPISYATIPVPKQVFYDMKANSAAYRLVSDQQDSAAGSSNLVAVDMPSLDLVLMFCESINPVRTVTIAEALVKGFNLDLLVKTPKYSDRH